MRITRRAAGTGAACLALTAQAAVPGAEELPLDRWTYVLVDDSRGKWGDYDEPEWLRYLGLDMRDMDRDGHPEILSGRYVYRSPGGDLAAPWERIDLGLNVDGVLFVDVDGDPYADVIAEALPRVYWLEAGDLRGHFWQAVIIGTLPETGHVNGQGFGRGDLTGDGEPEILLAAADGVYAARIPADPSPANWGFTRIAATSSDEGFALADLDGDGDADLVAGDVPVGGDEATALLWWRNPGEWRADWPAAVIGSTEHAIDRVELADLDGDGRTDVAVSEERWPGEEPDAGLYWFEAPDTPAGEWRRHLVVSQYSMNNLDVADLDRDGDVDIVTGEHKGPHLRLQVFENDGTGSFAGREIDRGKECHLGARLVDLDGDGDLDIVGHAWDAHRYLHVWRNDAVSRLVAWRHLSTEDGSLPATGLGAQQTASLVADLDGDGVNDFALTDRSVAPSVIWYRRTDTGWERRVIDDGPLRIEAGSASHDVDGDGDLDVLFAGDANSDGVWWWENPAPDFDPATPWPRRAIKSSGATKHHDQLVGDFDGDGRAELAFWNQGARTLWVAEIPEDPKSAGEWERRAVYRYRVDGQMLQTGQAGYPGWKGVNEHEGLAAADVDGDGVTDVVGGGRWFQHTAGGWVTHEVDPSYAFTRSAVGQLIEGGRPEVVLVAGDGVAPMYLYEWRDGTWRRQSLIDELDNGHTLDVVDFDGDGHLDVFSAEMRFGDGNPDAAIRILLGDGRGGFVHHVVARGLGVHEGRIADLDGDGDYDVLAKPYSWKAPRLDVFLNDGPLRAARQID